MELPSFEELFGKEGFSGEELSRADHAEAEQRLRAIGIVPKTPNECVRLVADKFSHLTSSVEVFNEVLDKMTDEELMQWAYQCNAAANGAAMLQQAMVLSILKRRLERGEGLDGLKGGLGF